jgi:hypothetical protein
MTSVAMCRNDPIGRLEDAVDPHPAVRVVRHAAGEDVAEVTRRHAPLAYSPRTSAQRREAAPPSLRVDSDVPGREAVPPPGTVGSPHQELTFARFT